jgi:hypothetical protein
VQHRPEYMSAAFRHPCSSATPSANIFGLTRISRAPGPRNRGQVFHVGITLNKVWYGGTFRGITLQRFDPPIVFDAETLGMKVLCFTEYTNKSLNAVKCRKDRGQE